MSFRTVKTLRLVILCIFLSGAALDDLRRRKVSNRWLFAGALMETAILGPEFVLPLFLAFFPVFLLFRLGLMGAGDGKVIMFIAGSLGLTKGALAVFSGFLAAALWCVIRIIRERSFSARFFRLIFVAGRIFGSGTVPESEKDMICSPDNSIPLAACLAAGTILFILMSEIRNL